MNKNQWLVSVAPSRGPVLLAVMIIVAVTAGLAVAVEPVAGVPEVQTLTLGAGYRWVTTDGGGETLAPSMSLSPSLTAEGRFLRLSGETTLDFSLLYGGSNDYGITGNYLVPGMLSLGLSATGIPYNIEKYILSPKAPDGFRPKDLSPDDGYRLDVAEQRAEGVIRAPQYPVQLRLSARRFTTDGTVQQLFFDENCRTYGCHVYSKSRDVSTQTEQFEAGANVHLGHANITYSFQATHFQDRRDTPVDDYGPISGFFTAGPREHNDYPGVAAGEHSLSLSTNGTGQLEFVGNLISGKRRNEDSEISESYLLGSGGVIWRPASGVAVDLRYSKRKVETEAEGANTIAMLTGKGLPLDRERTETVYRASAAYQPNGWVRLRGDASLRQLERSEAERWELPEETDTTTWKLSARLRPLKPLTVDVAFKGVFTDDPPYESSPSRESEYSVAASWKPGKQTVMQVSAKGIAGENGDTDRESNRLFADWVFTWAPVETVSLGFGLNWFRDDVTQPVSFAGGSSVDPSVPYSAEGGQVHVNAAYRPTEALSLSAAVSWLVAEGAYESDSPSLGDMGDYSKFEANRQQYEVEARYDIGSGWSVSCRAAYARNDGGLPEEDEEVGELSAAFSKAW